MAWIRVTRVMVDTAAIHEPVLLNAERAELDRRAQGKFPLARIAFCAGTGL